MVRHETSVFEIPQNRNDTDTVSISIICVYCICPLHIRCVGFAHHRVLQTSGRGWADSKAVHGMECNGGALALLEVPLSRGCCLKCTVLPVQGGVLTYTTECLTSQLRTNNKRNNHSPSCVRVVYIAGDTLRHQPMGAGHMTVLQLCRPIGFRILPWCYI